MRNAVFYLAGFDQGFAMLGAVHTLLGAHAAR
jgi:hypothetical protein